jgi:hypothetical protein
VPKAKPVFGSSEQSLSSQVKLGAGLKRTATPISVESLRRSKRIAMVNKGFKPASPVASLNKSKGRNRSLKTSPSAGKEFKFIIP